MKYFIHKGDREIREESKIEKEKPTLLRNQSELRFEGEDFAFQDRMEDFQLGELQAMVGKKLFELLGQKRLLLCQTLQFSLFQLRLRQRLFQALNLMHCVSPIERGRK